MNSSRGYRLLLNGDVLVDRLIMAESVFARMRGLLGRKHLPKSSAMLLRPCNSIHTVGMRFPLDVIFVDASVRVTRTIGNLKPNRFALGGQGAKAAIEAQAGWLDLSAIRPGTQLEISNNQY